MRLATIQSGSRDGRLVAVSRDGARYLAVGDAAPNLLSAIEDWDALGGIMQEIAHRLDSGEGETLDPSRCAAPLPRSWQWLDGSAFSTHGELMQIAFGLDPIESEKPLMYQGMSDRFYGPTDDVPLPSMEHGIDFEGEFGVIVDHVPMGTSAADAMKHIRLIVQINDWSLAPFAVTPDELGDAWQDGRVCLDLEIDWNGKRFGAANGREMDVGFHELVAHAAYTRDLVAGTVIGSGTVSNADYAKVGSSCISEIRAR